MKKTISDFLRYLRIPVSASYCEQLIASHPEYPSLLSIVDTLNRLGIPNIAAKIEKDKLPELVFPYVLHLSTGMGDFLAVKGPQDLIDNKDRLEYWKGVVLHIAPTGVVTDPDNDKNYKRERFFSFLFYLSATTVGLPLIWFTFTALSVVTISVSVLGIAGLTVGYLLVAKDIGIKFDAVESFCTPIGKRNDCDTVMSSEGASLLGGVKLSDLVFTYFLCQVVWLASLAVLPAWSVPVRQTLAAISVVAIPIVVYSVAYQYKIKTWCKLCLIVDGILLLQAGFFLTIFAQIDWTWSPSVMAAMAGSAIVVASTVIVFKGRMEDVYELRNAVSDAARVKNSTEVFGFLADQQERLVQYNSPVHLISGRPDAPIKLVMASNPYCKPCANQHKIIEKLIDSYPEQVSVEYRFIPAKDRLTATINTNQYIIEYWMRNINVFGNNRDQVKSMMSDWYEWMDLEKFRKKYPLDVDTPSEECVAMEKEHLEWTSRQGITKTPTTFINGVMLPKNYTPADLVPLVPLIAIEISRRAKEKASASQKAIESLV